MTTVRPVLAGSTVLYRQDAVAWTVESVTRYGIRIVQPSTGSSRLLVAATDRLGLVVIPTHQLELDNGVEIHHYWFDRADGAVHFYPIGGNRTGVWNLFDSDTEIVLGSYSSRDELLAAVPGHLDTLRARAHRS